MHTKECSEFFFCLDIELLIKMVLVTLQKPVLFLFFQTIQNLNKINSEHLFIDIGK